MLQLKAWLKGSIVILSLSTFFGLQGVEAVNSPGGENFRRVDVTENKVVSDQPIVNEHVIQEPWLNEVPYGVSGSVDSDVQQRGWHQRDWQDGRHHGDRWHHHDNHWNHHRHDHKHHGHHSGHHHHSHHGHHGDHHK